MYKVKRVTSDCKIADFDDTQLICSYFYLKQTFKCLYKRKLRNLNKRERKAIIYDLALFESIKQMNYTLRCLTPQKWLENWNIFNGITAEIKKRELSIN
jgi:hypothetical protein